MTGTNKNRVGSWIFNEEISPLLAILVTLFTVAMLISNVISNRQIAIGPFNTPGGVLIFPVTYILSDIFSEVYGYKWSRRTAWIGFSANLLMVGVFSLLLMLPAPVWFEDGEAFKTVLGSTWRLLAAGLIAYMLGDFVNDKVFKFFKIQAEKQDKVSLWNIRFGGVRHGGFAFRALFSSLCGELVDSCIFMPLAFLGVIPLAQLPTMIILQVLIKTGYEVVIIPITVLVMKKVSSAEELNGHKYDM